MDVWQGLWRLRTEASDRQISAVMFAGWRRDVRAGALDVGGAHRHVLDACAVEAARAGAKLRAAIRDVRSGAVAAGRL